MARLHGRGHVSDRLPLLALLPLLSLLILFEQHHHHHEAEAVGDAVTIPHWNPFKTHTCPAQNQNLNQNQPQYKLKHIIGRCSHQDEKCGRGHGICMAGQRKMPGRTRGEKRAQKGMDKANAHMELTKSQHQHENGVRTFVAKQFRTQSHAVGRAQTRLDKAKAKLYKETKKGDKERTEKQKKWKKAEQKRQKKAGGKKQVLVCCQKVVHKVKVEGQNSNAGGDPTGQWMSSDGGHFDGSKSKNAYQQHGLAAGYSFINGQPTNVQQQQHSTL